MFDLTPKPESHLGYYRLLGPNCGLRVSPICLGSMGFGTAMEKMMGRCDKNTTFEILDRYKSLGGNFIDLANNYQAGQSETLVGEWLAERCCRDEMVLATKYSFGLHAFHDKSKMSKVIQANYGGNSAKSMRISLEASLKKLQTTYVDILYVHFWTYDTPVEEVMSHLNDLVSSGKVLYLGISDTPAWIVSKANAYARAHGWRPFVAYQGQWSAAERSFEREILPMCRSEGMAIVPWGALGGGAFKTEEQWKQEDRRKARPPTEAQLKIGKVLESIASKRDTVVTSVALAYVLHKAPYVFPVCGGRSIKHLDQNIEALGLQLSRDEIVQIDDAVPFDKGFPHTFAAPQLTHDVIEGPDDLMVTRMDVVIDMVKKEQPIRAGVHSNV